MDRDSPARADPHHERDYYNISQAAALLGVSRVTLWRWVRAGQLPVWRLGHRTVRVKHADLQRLLREHPVARLRGPDQAAPAVAPDGALGDGLPRRAALEHFVQFYEADAYLLDAVGQFIGTALRAGETAL